MTHLSHSHIESIAILLETRRDLAIDSVDLLLNALKINDVEGIKIALRSLGVNPQDEMVLEVCALTASLHSLVEDFKTSVEESKDGGLPGAVRRLKDVVKMNFEAADRTLERCEKQGYLYRDHREHIEELERAIKDSSQQWPESVKEKFAALKKDVDMMQKENHEVIMAQSFQDISGQTVNNVINLMQNIEQQIVALTVACTDNTDISKAVHQVRTKREEKTSQAEVDQIILRKNSHAS